MPTGHMESFLYFESLNVYCRSGNLGNILEFLVHSDWTETCQFFEKPQMSVSSSLFLMAVHFLEKQVSVFVWWIINLAASILGAKSGEGSEDLTVYYAHSLCLIFYLISYLSLLYTWCVVVQKLSGLFSLANKSPGCAVWGWNLKCVTASHRCSFSLLLAQASPLYLVLKNSWFLLGWSPYFSLISIFPCILFY